MKEDALLPTCSRLTRQTGSVDSGCSATTQPRAFDGTASAGGEACGVDSNTLRLNGEISEVVEKGRGNEQFS
jgi:hypothetical protein